MKNRKLLLIVSLVLALTMSLGGTLAYLTDTDADVNTMTLGNVKIVQNEQMRDENGELVEYQDKPALPAVYDEIAYDDKKITIGGAEYEVFDADMKNVNDKIVTVTNMGNTKAYVRTIIAIEAPAKTDEYDAFDDDLVHLKLNAEGITWSEEWNEVVTADGVRYVYSIATYTEALAAKATSAPSLLQVFLDKTTDNEDLAMLGEEWEIIALSQAVQADGFDSADEALNEAFDMGELATWLANAKDNVGSAGDKNDTNNPPYVPVNSVEELQAAAADNKAITGDVTFAENENVTLDGAYMIAKEGESTLDGNNGTLTTTFVQTFGGDLEVKDVTITAGSATNYSNIADAGAEVSYDNVNVYSAGGGIAAIGGAQVTFNSGSLEINTSSTSGRYLFYAADDGSVITINGGDFDFNKTQNQKRAYIYASAGTTVYVNGGTFGKASTRSGYTAGILGEGTVIITGGTFGFDPSAWVAEGYQAVQNGTTWTVSAQ